MLTILVLLSTFYSCSTPPEKEEEKQKIFNIAIDSNWMRMPLFGRQNNLKGFIYDLIRIIAEEEQITINLIQTPNYSTAQALQNENINAVISSNIILDSYKNYYVFSKPFFYLGPVLVVNEDSDITSFEDSNNKSIGVLSGSDSILYLEKKSSIKIQSYHNILEGIDDLINKKIDGVIIGLVLANDYTRNIYKDKIKIVTGSLTDEALRLITLKGDGIDNNELIEIFNRNIDKFISDERYDMLLQKWHLFQ